MPFAERPEFAAPDARIIWSSGVDPSVLPVRAEPTTGDDPDGFDIASLENCSTIVSGADGIQHLALSNGRNRIRIDVTEGTLAPDEPVRLYYLLSGNDGLEAKILALRRFSTLVRTDRFARSLFPPDRRTVRWVSMLRVHDARREGATLREIAIVLYGEARVSEEWDRRSDSLKSRVRRMLLEAEWLAGGGYLDLLR